jgi:putative GTP pyrophosphokinase
MEDRRPLPGWSEDYAQRSPLFEQLASEATFALNLATDKRKIKTHSVTSRVKTESSIANKAKEKELDDPLAELDDLVGVRVVVLFLSDLPGLDQLVRESFDVLSSEDKVTEGDPASFGYMSVHYVVTLDDTHSGPRYDHLKEISFEIQTRTVVMDAWANVSHYLDYKGESSVPEDLRKDFYALSGLFYVADQHFEIFADRSRESREQAEKDLDSGESGELKINRDTLAAFLAQRYPDRRQSDGAAVSELVDEIIEAGFQHLGPLEKMLDQVEPKFKKYERETPPTVGAGPGRFASVGVIRVSLRLQRGKKTK